jgi:hypothetical protein
MSEKQLSMFPEPPTPAANSQAGEKASLGGGPATPPTNREPELAPQRIPHWLQQAERFLRVIVRIYLGLLVCFAPWYSPAWDANPLFSQSPSLMAFISNGAVRGLVSGLGLLNLWIALRDAMRPSDLPPSEMPGPR